ncbi:MAG: DUF6054 family protein [Traorella sp.]
MANYQVNFHGDFEDFRNYLLEYLEKKSKSLSLEEHHFIEVNDVDCMTYLFRRFSLGEGCFVNMYISLCHFHGEIDVFASTSSGSLVGVGEESFLNTLIEPIEKYIHEHENHS